MAHTEPPILSPDLAAMLTRIERKLDKLIDALAQDDQDSAPVTFESYLALLEADPNDPR